MTAPYQDLDPTKRQIRLLSLKDDEDDIISCTLQTFDLEAAPNYKALSYEWGPPEPKQTILVNGIEVHISPNLFEFLQVYRKREDRGLIWIDQLSINQMDDRERGHQVGMMEHIYRNAELTYLWLGQDHEGALPMATIKNLLELWVSMGRCCQGDEDLIWNTNTGKLAGTSYTLLKRLPYWGRHWVLQEIILSRAKLVLYGSEELSWTAFMEVDHLDNDWSSPVPSIIYVQQEHDRSKLPHENSSIEQAWHDVMAYARESSCSDPRDKILGSQSILYYGLQIPPDYTLSVRDVFLKAVELYFERFVTLSCYNLRVAFLRSIENLAVGMDLKWRHDYKFSHYWTIIDHLAASFKNTERRSWDIFCQYLEQEMLEPTTCRSVGNQ